MGSFSSGQPRLRRPSGLVRLFLKKQDQKGRFAYLINGDISIDHKQFHIDIPYRVPVPNKSMYTVKALLIFEAENCTQVEKFNEYVKYFRCKDS